MPPQATPGVTPVRTLIVDDHVIVRQGLRAVLAAEPAVQVVGEAGDAPSARRAVAALRPDLVLMDLRLGGSDADGAEPAGIRLCRELTEALPDIKVLVLTTFVSESLVLQAIRAGARGYVLKDVDAVRLVEAIQAVRRGESAFDSHAAAVVVASLQDGAPAPDAGAALSQRESEVLALVGRGLSNQQIGSELYISAATVKFHLRNIMSKLGVHRRAELAYRAGQMERR